ncbi:MAG: F0F1 ATP synthase subunit gamma [Alphaproteobacteria bacterium]
MPSLKDLKNRITSVQSTKRITSAMKMVAAAKLKKAQEAADQARPYASHMNSMLSAVANGVVAGNGPELLIGTGKDQTHLLVVISSDRGLCGGLNGALVRGVRKQIQHLKADGKTVKLMIVGRKGVGLLKRLYASDIVKTHEDLLKPAPAFAHADLVRETILAMFEAGEFDVCTLYYNKFISALTQEVTPLQLIPFKLEEKADDAKHTGSQAVYEFEPDEETILNHLLPKNLAVQIFRAMLEGFASEQGARMTAMDNATRNAGDMINRLSIRYNRTRQAQITKELIEIISGAEAL